MYKFIDEHTVEQFQGGAIYHNNLVYANPTAGQLAMAGYKELVAEDKPEGAYEPYYEDGDVITKKWRAKDDTDEGE